MSWLSTEGDEILNAHMFLLQSLIVIRDKSLGAILYGPVQENHPERTSLTNGLEQSKSNNFAAKKV